MENTNFNNNNNNNKTDGEEEAPFEFKNLLSEMFMTSFPNQSSSSLEIPKIAFSCSTSTNSSSSSQNNIISFGNPDSNYFLEDNDKVMMMSSSISSSSTTSAVAKRICRSPLQSQDHLLAERKRRERFSQLFAVLAKTIPALNKLDKASILEDAIKYIGELQERVRGLEEAAGGTNLIESTVTTAQKQHYSVAANTSCDDNSFLMTRMNIVDDESKRHENHDIKVQILDKNVLIGILCNKQMRSIFSIIAGIMEKLHLTIHHIRVTPSNHTSLHCISILAEIDENVDIKVHDVEKAFELITSSIF